MLGLWEDSIAANRSALEIQPEYYHAMDFMVYAHLQLAQDTKAKAIMEQAFSRVRSASRPASANMPLAAMTARYVLERADWTGAAVLLPGIAGMSAQAESMIHFARGLGLARSGDPAGAKREVDSMAALRSALQKSGQSYWAERTEEQMLAVSAWAAHAEGAREQALKFMRAAADGEDSSVKHVAMENRLYPMRELLAELLLEMGQAAPALREFETALHENPNRYRGLYGAARAAEAAGDRQKAAGYFKRFVALSGNADTVRPELARAKASLAQR
jgi:tetratricopeptide (TPR) repeat protein